MECYEKGIISERETGGLDLSFGNANAIMTALDEIVHNRGFLETCFPRVLSERQPPGGALRKIAW